MIEEELARLLILENFNHFNIVDMSVQKKNQTISGTNVRNIVTQTGELSFSDLFPL